MQKTVLTFGLISGFIVLLLWFGTRPLWIDDAGKMDMDTGSIMGYTSILVSLSLIFFGIRQYRDRTLQGSISFGRAFKVGILIALIASVMYVLGWMIYYNTSDIAQTFPEQYSNYMKEKWASAGMSQEDISEKSAQMEKNFTLYQNPVIMAGMTLMEIFPIGIVISLISALILKRKRKTEDLV